MPLINCPQCGKPISDKAKRCPHCGYEAEQSEAPKKSSATKIILIFLAICAICAGLFFVLRGSQNEADDVNTEDGEAVEEVCVEVEPVEFVADCPASVVEDTISYSNLHNYDELDGETLYRVLLQRKERGEMFALTDNSLNKLTEEQKAALGIGVQSTELVIASDEVEDMPVTTHTTEIIIGEVEDEEAPAKENVNRQAVKEEVAHPQPKPVDDKIWSQSDVDEKAQFPGGDEALLRYIEDKIEYPQDAKENGIQGRVIVRAIVDRNGDISTVTVVRGRDKSLDKEAFKIVKSLPKFVPARKGGQPVKSEYIIPVTFKIK